MLVSYKFPLLVQLAYHPDSTGAVAVADFLHRALNDDSAVPGLRVPTFFMPLRGVSAPPEPELASEAERTCVVLLADDHLAMNARRITGWGETWADYAVSLRRACEFSNTHRFVPIQLTAHGRPIDPRLNDHNFLPAWTIGDPDERLRFIARRLVHLLVRHLRATSHGDDSPPVTIFISHAKLDLEHEPRAVRSLVAHLVATQPEKTWFDTGDIACGSRFAAEIERGVKDAALLVVATDSYSSRSWCRRELLLAKRHQRPVVVVNALREGEVRSFPYAGNVPVILWQGRPQAVVDLLLRETLRHAYAEASLKHQQHPGDVVLPAGPELLTLVRRNKTDAVLYPDPPLGPEELAVLSATGVRVETPLERHARERDLRAHSLVVALSVSESEDVGRFGLRRVHLDAILLELSRYLLLSGIRLAYGGHLHADGYTVRLADLLHDPIVAQLRGDPPATTAPVPELITYVAWPMPASIHEEARLGPLVEVRDCHMPADLDEQRDAPLVATLADDLPITTAAERFGWARGLTAMRERQTSEVAARIVVGGRIGPTGQGYKGRIPGVLEEALLSIRAGQPTFLVGAVGGGGRLVLDALEGVTRPELTWEYQRTVPYSDELRQMYIDRKQPWDDYDGIVALFRDRGLAGLNNGLSLTENRELGATRSVERMVELVLRGLQRVYAPAPQQPTPEA